MSCAFARLQTWSVAAALGAVLAAGVALADPMTVDPLAGAGAKPSQSQELTDGVTHFKNGDVEGALKLFKEAAAKNSDLPPAQLVLASLFSQAKQDPAARIWLEKTVIEDPKDPEAYVLMGDLAIRERRVTEAEMLFTKANAVLKDFNKSEKRKKILTTRVFSGLAAVAEARDDWETALKYLQNWVKVEPENPNALQRLGRALFQTKKPAEALEQLKAAAKYDDKMLTPQAIIAQWYETTGDRENATKMMTEALNTAPNDLRTRLAAANWALQTEQFDDALNQVNSALQLDANSLEAKILRGNVAMCQKDFKTAEIQFESAVLQSPFNFAASNNLALALAEQEDSGKKLRALEYATVNVQRYPKQAESHSTLGWVQFRLGRLDDAERSLQTSISSGVASPDTAYYLACVAKARDKNDLAVKLLEGALQAKGLFTYRKEAEDLLKSLKKK